MKKSMLVALAITLGAGANVALAEVGPDFAKPFGSRGYSAPSVATTVAGPVTNDAEATARLQADGYRAIDVVRGGDGAWHGTALRGAARMRVTVGPDGTITAR